MKPMAYRRKREGWIPTVLYSLVIALLLVAIIPSPHYWFLPLFIFLFGLAVLAFGVAMGRDTLRKVQALAGTALIGGVFIWFFQMILKSLRAG